MYRDANSLAIFFPWGFGESGNRGLHFFIPRGSGNLEPIPQGPRGIFEELDPLNEQANLSKMLT